MEWISILIVAAVAVFFWMLSNQRVKRLHQYTDVFAKAFCEAADHVIPKDTDDLVLRYRRSDDGRIQLLPAEEQSEGVRKILENGVDAYTMERLSTMYRARDDAQSLLTTVNLVGNKFNAPLNFSYDLANLALSFIDDPSKLSTQDDLDTLENYLNKQKFYRNTTFPPIVSEACKKEIAVP